MPHDAPRVSATSPELAISFTPFALPHLTMTGSIVTPYFFMMGGRAESGIRLPQFALMLLDSLQIGTEVHALRGAEHF
jgi:hypothetical protein